MSSTHEPPQESFAETALKLGGKGAEEIRRTGELDAADDQVEALFAARYQTTNSPIHRAVWERETPVDLFGSQNVAPSAVAAKVMADSLDVAKRHRAAGTLHDEHGKVSSTVLSDLAAVGYWGLLIEAKHGGSGASFASFAPFLTQMAVIDPTVAGLASVHGCIGAVDPVKTFGTEEQKANWLPQLASGKRLSAFALTEPCAGSDLTALRTRAVRDGDDYIVTGEKLFITNVVPGRTIGLVCLIDERPAVLVVDLPAEENETFRLRKYGLYALKHTHNQGILFNNFRVPVANRLLPPRGDGLTIAYHGLNLGRVALCANAAGTMRSMLASVLPWAKFRRTYGAEIAQRELVQRRVARLASLIVGCDALVAWCAGLLDLGFRGEMECMLAKVFASEAQKEAAIEILMKTHGGRAFLHGHPFGDHVHEFLAPCIYEGEGEMLSMGLFKSLVKQHGMTYFEPLGKAMQAAGIRKPNPYNPLHAWKLRKAAWPYLRWTMQQTLRPSRVAKFPHLPPALAKYSHFAITGLRAMGLQLSRAMSKHKLKLADRQCRIQELSQRVQDLVVMLVVSLYGARQTDSQIQLAAEVLAQSLHQKLTCRRPTDAELRRIVELGASIAERGFAPCNGIAAGELLMPYAADEAGKPSTL
jgi:alkylation response protein AidB-like acyl-CoA dehydrogenase